MARRVLLAQTSFLGDVVLSTALARTIAGAWPESELWWLVRPEAVSLLTPTFGHDRVIAFDKRGVHRGLGGLLATSHALAKHGFDVAIGVQRSLRTSVLLARARIPMRIGYAGSPGAWLYHRRVAKDGAHARDRLIGLVAGLGIQVPTELPMPHLGVAPESARRIEERLESEGVPPDQGLLLVAPGSAWATKQWPAAAFGQAAARLRTLGNDRVVVVGTRSDRPLAREIARLVAEGGGDTIDATGGTTIADAVAWIARARLVLANDSAPAHIAAALGRPVVTMFGPTVPAQGFAPLGDRVQIVERELACRPCSRHGGNDCPIGTHECLADLSPDEVVSAGEALLERAVSGRGTA